MMRESGPLVSILVPAYNAETTLAETLQSVLASSYSNLELALVDDGSTDATAEVAEAIATKDARVRVFRRPHRGVSAALNFGLEEVHGELVARLDADDLWHPTKLQKQVELFAANPAAALACTFVRYIDGGGRIVRDAAPQRLAGPAICRCLYDGIVGGGSSAVFRRSVLDMVGGYDEEFPIWEDLLLHLKVAAAGSVAFVPEYLTGYRLSRESSSANLDQSLASWRRASKRIEAEFSKVPPFVRRWSHARRLLELAEGFAFDKRYSMSARLLAECVVCDPVRTSAFLGYRFHRRLSGGRRPLNQNGPSFSDADPTVSYCLSDFDAGLEGDRLHRLDLSRDLQFETIDRDVRPLLQPTGVAETTPPVVAVP